MELETSCPYCGEPSAVIDEGGGANQNYVEGLRSVLQADAGRGFGDLTASRLT